ADLALSAVLPDIIRQAKAEAWDSASAVSPMTDYLTDEMVESAAGWIARRRALLDAAPPAPWRYREGAEGDPTNGPTYTAIEAEHPEAGWSPI
ncbi:hypothetical protein, partial [Enterococcus faecium]|uniref:hypothetical protein n=1 Tax=Enterococcus faecium TaxID=1352 RepID=UPI0039FC8C03